MTVRVARSAAAAAERDAVDAVRYYRTAEQYVGVGGAFDRSTVSIPRRDCAVLTAEAFRAHFAAEQGGHRRSVLIYGLMETWPARTRWQFNALRSSHGKCVAKADYWGRKLPLRTIIDMMEEQGEPSILKKESVPLQVYEAGVRAR